MTNPTYFRMWFILFLTARNLEYININSLKVTKYHNKQNFDPIEEHRSFPLNIFQYLDYTLAAPTELKYKRIFVCIQKNLLLIKYSIILSPSFSYSFISHIFYSNLQFTMLMLFLTPKIKNMGCFYIHNGFFDIRLVAEKVQNQGVLLMTTNIMHIRPFFDFSVWISVLL